MLRYATSISRARSQLDMQESYLFPGQKAGKTLFQLFEAQSKLMSDIKIRVTMCFMCSLTLQRRFRSLNGLVAEKTKTRSSPDLSSGHRLLLDKNGSHHVANDLIKASLIFLIGLQYVFAIAAGTGFEAGGELYKSDYYGSHESWKNITGDLPGRTSKAPDAYSCWESVSRS